MEAALELEDDVFFKDLSKQISLLIMDDDDQQHSHSHSHSPPFNSQASIQANNPATQSSSFFSYDQHQASNRESKGTGVFIPRSSSNSRRRSARQARFMASANKFQRPFDHGSRGLSPDTLINPSYDHSFRRF
ncbi:hypothetical protein SASPL_109177 [Salvia splendens]|uniref:Uncharacterized protein n=1 Tax=Salvia splendens TaxID=180675 RepID=A0A8X9A629_SALSN|nr:uncharacterized protein LOC121793971 [Salvia splendens]KAG6431102.1 hypothetical protein SASPL_109177 [Salvia splendens]